MLNQAELDRQTDMRYWFPKIKELEINVPKTVFVNADYGDLLSSLDGKLPASWPDLLERLSNAVEKVGEPFFLRTAYLSGKHEWSNTCYCENLGSLDRNIVGLIEHTEMSFTVPFGCFVVREFLNLNSIFNAFDGMPIAREFRFFVQDEKVLHWQPYWPADSIRDPSIDNWEGILQRMSILDSWSMDYLGYWVQQVGKKLGGFWSVDFAQHVDGRWFLIDMARGEESFYWDTDGPAEEGKCGLDLLAKGN